MSGTKVVLGLLAGVAVLAGAGIWLAMQDPGAATGPAGAAPGADAAAAADPGSVDARPTKRKTVKRSGDGSVIGRVLFRKGDVPAAGQRVVLDLADSTPFETVAEEDGTFRLAELPAGGPYELRVEAEGFAAVRIPGLALDPREELDVGTLWLDKAVRVAVSVRTYADSAVPGAEVRAFAVAELKGNVDWSSRMAQIGIEPTAVATAATDAEGVAVFPELATGPWTFTAHKEGFARRGGTTTVRAPEPGADEPQPYVVYLDRAFELSGRVLDHGDAPIEGAQILVTAPGSGWNLAAGPLHLRATTDETGAYRFDAVPAGAMALWAGRPGGVPTQVATVQIPGVDRFDIFLKNGGVLTGTVTEKETGAAVEGCLVRASSWWNGISRIADATTDATGRYTIDTLLEGNVNSVVVTKPGMSQVLDANPWQQFPINRGEVVERNFELRKASSLVGTVTGPDGPVSGARVTAYVAGNWGAQKHGVSDKNGAYRIEDLAAGKALIQVFAAGFFQPDFPEQWWTALQSGTLPERWSVEIEEGGEATLDLLLSPGQSVEGRVEDALGAPVEGAFVRPNGRSETDNVLTGADGSFRVDGVAPGNSYLVAGRTGARPIQVIRQITVTEDEPTRDVVIRLQEMAKVRGRVSSGRAGGVEDASVGIRYIAEPGARQQSWASSPVRSSLGATAAVRADGTYEIDMPYVDGTFVVWARALEHVHSESEPEVIVPGQAEYTVDVTLGPGNPLSGRVIESSGAGIAGARISLQTGKRRGGEGKRTSFGGSRQQSTVVAVSAADGSFRLATVPDGDWSVDASCDGFIPSGTAVTLPGTSEIDVILHRELEIGGVVVLADGSPVMGAQVQALDSQTGRPQGGRGGNVPPTFTGTDGTYRIDGLEPGEYRVQVSPDWHGMANILPATSDPVAAGAEGVRITVTPGLSISGRLVGPDGKPVPRVSVSARPETKGPGGISRSAQSGGEGVFTITGLREGPHTLVVQADWNSPGAAALQPLEKTGVSAGTTDLALQLEEGLTISGVVVDGEGAPVSGLNLNVQVAPAAQGRPRVTSMQWKQVVTDRKGAFLVVGLSAGDYILRASGQSNVDSRRRTDGAPAVESVLIGADRVAAGTTNIELSYVAGGTIEGTVMDEGGRPFARANVSASPSEGGNGRSETTDAEGRFAVTGLVPGKNYTLTAHCAGASSAKTENVPTGTAAVRIVIERGLTIAGRVFDRAGEPAARASLRLASADGRHRTQTGIQPDGSFEVIQLRPGRYSLELMRRVRNADGKWVQEAVPLGEVEAGSVGVELRLTTD